MGLTVTDVGLEKKSVTHELKKHAASIHCSNTLSLLQRKISNALLYHAYGELLLKEEHEISIKQLCRLISYNGNNHAAIREALKELLSTVIEWNLVNDVTGTENWTASSILASVSLEGPLCYYAYSPRMKQLLHSPSMFGKINLFIQSRFKSSYGLALYENCIRYRGLPFTKWFDMEIFRKLMGISHSKYTIFRDFKRRVLDKSVEEVNTYSDLIVEPEFLREGRQVVKIRFSLKERAKKNRIGIGTQKENSDEIDARKKLQKKLIVDYGLSEDQWREVTKEYKDHFITEKIAVIESSKNFQEGKVKNLAAYFMSALKHDYQPSRTSLNPVKAKISREDQQSTTHRKQKKIVEEVKKDYLIYRENEIDATIHSLSADEQKNFLERFYVFAEITINIVLKLQRKKYTQETVLNSPQIKALLRQYALQEIPFLKKKIISFEQFVDALPPQKKEIWKAVENLESVCE